MESFKVRKWMSSSTMNLLFIQHFFITQGTYLPFIFFVGMEDCEVLCGSLAVLNL
jgi:hypothetical protein